MVFYVLATLLSWLIDLGTLQFQSDSDKELEILLLRRQLAILQRTQPRPPRLTRWEKLGLAVLAGKLHCLPTAARSRVTASLVCFTSETRLKWQRELVRRKVYLAGCTRHPTAARVTQQARNVARHLQDGTLPARVLLHDRDGKFPMEGC
jgi:hypothetical protein